MCGLSFGMDENVGQAVIKLWQGWRHFRRGFFPLPRRNIEKIEDKEGRRRRVLNAADVARSRIVSPGERWTAHINRRSGIERLAWYGKVQGEKASGWQIYTRGQFHRICCTCQYKQLQLLSFWIIERLDSSLCRDFTGVKKKDERRRMNEWTLFWRCWEMSTLAR